MVFTEIIWLAQKKILCKVLPSWLVLTSRGEKTPPIQTWPQEHPRNGEEMLVIALGAAVAAAEQISW